MNNDRNMPGRNRIRVRVDQTALLGQLSRLLEISDSYAGLKEENLEVLLVGRR